MKVILIKNNRLYNYKLPVEVKDNFWITDIDNLDNQRNLINIIAVNNKWVLKSNYDTKIVSGEKVYEEVLLTDHTFYVIKNASEKNYYYIYALPDYEEYQRYQVLQDGSLKIGKNGDNNISYGHILVGDLHAELFFQKNQYIIQDKGSKFGTYVNDQKITGNYKLKYGDIVFIAGLKIIVMSNFILINNVKDSVKVISQLLTFKQEDRFELDNTGLKDEELERALYSKEDYFYRSPRFIEDVKKEDVAIEDPPTKVPVEDNSLLMTIGPMFTMALTSLTTLATTINSVVQGDTTWKKSWPSLVIGITMLISMILWPLLNKHNDKKKKIKREKDRLEKYGNYLDGKKNDILSIIQKQSQTLKDKYIPLIECQNIIFRRKSNLWERSLEQSDFLSLRLGTGNIPIEANINYSKEKFTMEEDELKNKIYDVVNNNNTLTDVPIVMNFIEKNVSAFIGDPVLTMNYFQGLFLQIMAFHSYEFLKVVILTDDENKSRWDYIKNSPYLFDDYRQTRFFAANMDETKELSLYLEKIYQERKNGDAEKKHLIPPYFLIVTDNYHLYRDIEIITDILNDNVNVGFSLMMISEKLQNLPSECKNFINVNKEKSGIFESEISAGNQKEFKTEFPDNIDINTCIKLISNYPIEFNDEEKKLPNAVSFLEMYGVGKLEELNVLNRWKENNSQKSLAVPIGVEKSGSLLKLDLHEKYHGPHGLIAGMTGSGKSEFIITYILSLAINFSPLDVNFILIDYKGGGLAGAFENRETGVMLPHLAGTITNLDASEMNRSLASIQSELRRRQQIFNAARDKLGESTVDIYKYQKFFKEGLVEEPVPHLFIISDEFAELKSQQPDFMDQLISAARIGRSLGIHLILATQKPSGVVNDQIWSNSRFRVCLKVQDKSDSSEMIKRPDAALLKNVGRFYLQVGFNELFALGQSAWAGAQYFPKDKVKKKVDQGITIIDNIGNVVASYDDTKNDNTESMGEELGNIMKYIIEVAKTNNLGTKRLWLEKILPDIYVTNLFTKYEIAETPYQLNPVIGEFDDPSNQRQDVLRMNLTTDGNQAIYGSSGSGKEMLLGTMIYSLCSCHTPDEVNIYIMDFGAGTLGTYSRLPHVGDVVTATQEEKVNNLIKLFENELEDRKKLFLNFNGDYQTYIKRSGKTVPYMLLIVNNFDVFQDTYDMDERLMALTRDCFKYGIIVLATVNTTGGMRFKLRQNFKSNITLQFNDEDDYSVILGNTHKLYPSQTYGRGLVKLDNIYEFQTAKIVKDDEPDKIDEYIKVIVDKYPSSKVRKIPSVPKYVSIDNMYPHVKELSMIPVGINKETIEPEFYNFSEPSTIISANEVESLTEFTKVVASLTSRVDNTSIIVFDTDNNLSGEYQTNVGVINSGFDSNVNKIFDCINKEYDIYVNDGYSNKNLLGYKKMVIIVSNLTKFLMKIDTLTKDRFTSEIEKIRDLGNISFVFTGQVDNLKKLEYDKWYKTVVDSNCGIWVGDGIADQQLIKTNIGFKKTNNEVPEGYGIVVKNSKTYLVNLTSFKKEEEND